MVNAKGVVYPTQPWMLCNATGHEPASVKIPPRDTEDNQYRLVRMTWPSADLEPMPRGKCAAAHRDW